MHREKKKKMKKNKEGKNTPSTIICDARLGEQIGARHVSAVNR